MASPVKFLSPEEWDANRRVAFEWRRIQPSAQADELKAAMVAKVGPEKWDYYVRLAADLKEETLAPRRKGVFRQARRVSKSPETWRSLSNYPTYEISSHGRVRSLDRANPTDWLKPRRKWFRGVCVEYVVINDRDGKRCERMVGKLLIAAGFLEKPAWMKGE